MSIFGVYLGALAALPQMQAVIGQAKAQEDRFQKSLEGLEPAEVLKRYEDREREREKYRAQLEAERRHRELCQAIRDSRPRGFGLFF